MRATPDISYTPRPDATPEGELTSLASVYRFIFESAKKRGRVLDKSGPDDAERNLSDSASTQSTS